MLSCIAWLPLERFVNLWWAAAGWKPQLYDPCVIDDNWTVIGRYPLLQCSSWTTSTCAVLQATAKVLDWRKTIVPQKHGKLQRNSIDTKGCLIKLNPVYILPGTHVKQPDTVLSVLFIWRLENLKLMIQQFHKVANQNIVQTTLCRVWISSSKSTSFIELFYW